MIGSDLSTSVVKLVINPNGSGQAPFMRGALLEAERWFRTATHPGTQPLAELEAALLCVTVGPLPVLLSQLSEDRRGPVRAARRVLPADQDVERLPFISQFENYTVSALAG